MYKQVKESVLEKLDKNRTMYATSDNQRDNLPYGDCPYLFLMPQELRPACRCYVKIGPKHSIISRLEIHPERSDEAPSFKEMFYKLAIRIIIRRSIGMNKPYLYIFFFDDLLINPLLDHKFSISYSKDHDSHKGIYKAKRKVNING